MKWFKHDSDANMDAKLQEVLLDYGLEGYGLYWYCIELIVNKIDSDNITFQIEHDSRIIARNTGSSPQKIQEMMSRFIELKLFENTNGSVTCFKLAKRLDKSMTSNKKMRILIDKIKDISHDCIMINHDAIMTESENVMQEETREEEIRLEENNAIQDKPANCPYGQIVKLYREILVSSGLNDVKDPDSWSKKRKSHVQARWRKKPELEYWEKVFKYIRDQNPFLLGKNQPQDKRVFKADLDWIFNETNLVKILEGKYQ